MGRKDTHTHTHGQAIRPCYPSHSMPLALVLPREDQGRINGTSNKNLWSDATKGTHSLYLHRVSSASLPACLLSYPLDRLSGSAVATGPSFSYLRLFVFPTFFAQPSLLRFPHGVYNSSCCGVSCVPSPLLHPPRYCPLPPDSGL